jgi:hypothetical protein
MFTRDYVLRQIHQLVKALAEISVKRKSEELEEARALLTETIQGITGMDLIRLRSADKEEVLAFCADGIPSKSELMSGVADLLVEDAEVSRLQGDIDAARKSWLRSQWLYEAAASSGGILPYDLHDRLANVEELLRTFQSTP